jgi:hypothetical protein
MANAYCRVCTYHLHNATAFVTVVLSKVWVVLAGVSQVADAHDHGGDRQQQPDCQA